MLNENLYLHLLTQYLMFPFIQTDTTRHWVRVFFLSQLLFSTNKMIHNTDLYKILLQ